MLEETLMSCSPSLNTQIYYKCLIEPHKFKEKTKVSLVEYQKLLEKKFQS